MSGTEFLLNNGAIAQGIVVLTDAGGNAFPSTGGGGGGDASAANQTIQITQLGSLTETAPSTDTASSGLNGRLQRVAQLLSSLLSSTQRTTSFSLVSTPGSFLAGAKSVTFSNVGGAVGSLKGVPLPIGISVTFDATGRDTLDAIAYDGTGTQLLIAGVR